MPALLTDYGEEWYTTVALDAETLTGALYSQTTDGLGESSDVGDITSEPNGASYARQSSAMSAKAFSSQYGIGNDATLSFDTSDSTNTVDHAAFIGTLNSNTRLLAIAPLNDTRDLNNFKEITIETDLFKMTID